MWYYPLETWVFFFIGYLSFCPLLQYLVGHIFNHIEAIRNTNAWKFTGPRKSLMAWGTWEEISFLLGSETWDDRSLTDTRRHFSGGHRFRRVGGACWSLPVDLAVLPDLPPASNCSALASPGPSVCKLSDPPEHIAGEKAKWQETLGARLKREEKRNDLKIHHPNYARIMNSYKCMVHIVFICLNSAFRKEVLSLWQRLNERVWKSRYF